MSRRTKEERMLKMHIYNKEGSKGLCGFEWGEEWDYFPYPHSLKDLEHFKEGFKDRYEVILCKRCFQLAEKGLMREARKDE